MSELLTTPKIKHRTFPYYVGGKLSGEPLPHIESGITTIRIPYIENLPSWSYPLEADTTLLIPHEELIYQRHGFYFSHTDEELWAWLDCDFDEASRIIWRTLLDSVGAIHNGHSEYVGAR